jgi:hypothetical protein
VNEKERKKLKELNSHLLCNECGNVIDESLEDGLFGDNEFDLLQRLQAEFESRKTSDRFDAFFL